MNFKPGDYFMMDEFEVSKLEKYCSSLSVNSVYKVIRVEWGLLVIDIVNNSNYPGNLYIMANHCKKVTPVVKSHRKLLL